MKNIIQHNDIWARALKHSFVTMSFLSAFLISSQAATLHWTGEISQEWANSGNFQSESGGGQGVPQDGDNVLLSTTALHAPCFSGGGSAILDTIFASRDMIVTRGGSLFASVLKIGWNASAILTVNGGTLVVSNHLDLGGYNGGTAIMNIAGGSVRAGELFFNMNRDGGHTLGGSQLNLTGGILTVDGPLSLNKRHLCLLNIAGGTLVLPRDQLANFNFWVLDGSIAAFGMTGTTNSFAIDQATILGKLVITAVNPGFTEETFVQWNPEVFRNLTSSLGQAMKRVPPGVAVLADADYSFGCAAATNGDIFFTEFGKMRVSQYSPKSGTVTTVVTNRESVYGIAIDTADNLFYAQDSAVGAGRVIWRAPGRNEQTIITNLTNPRQLATDADGNLYVVLEAGQILKWTKDTGLTTVFLERGKMPGLPQGLAVAPDGRIYFSTYARVGGRGTQLTKGTVWVRETNGIVRLVAGGISRGRGLSLDSVGNVYVASEANVWDNGNSGALIRIAANGNITRFAVGLDYPQFPAVGKDGKIYFTIVRDNKLVAYDPQNQFATQEISGRGLTLITEGGTWRQSAGAGLPIQLKIANTNNDADSITISGWLDITNEARQMNMWFNIPVTNLNISLAKIPDPYNGNTNTAIYELPEVSAEWDNGSVKNFVMPLREHRRSRWPVLNDDNPAVISFPQDFGESPLAYLVHLRVSTSK